MGEELKKINAGRSTAGITPLSEEEFENILDQEEYYEVQERIGVLEWFYDLFTGNGDDEDDNEDKDSTLQDTIEDDHSVIDNNVPLCKSDDSEKDNQTSTVNHLKYFLSW